MTETAMLPLGPYAFYITIENEKIIRTEILKEPLLKRKKLSIKFMHIQESTKKFIQGKAGAFDGVAIDVSGTDFQKKVWKAAVKIPYAQTRTYAQIAKEIGHPKAVRAVGTALGKNPVCVVVPCHRVVPSSGGIGGYAYGTDVKGWLLDHEAGRV